MTKVRFIEHEGHIEEVNADNVKVKILSESACASCHAKGACTASDSKEKSIDVYHLGFTNLKIGQKVIIQGQKSLGLKAALLAYIVPLVLVVTTLFTTIAITNNEALAGILAIVVLVPYYFILKKITPKLKNTFVFTLKKIID